MEDRILRIRLEELGVQLRGLKETLSEKDYRIVLGALANAAGWVESRHCMTQAVRPIPQCRSGPAK